MNKFDITIVSPKGLCSQPLPNLLVQLPSEGYEHLHEDLHGEEMCSAESDEWPLAFDGYSTYRGDDVGVVLHAPANTNISLVFKLKFSYTNNEAEYEALIIRLTFTIDMGI